MGIVLNEYEWAEHAIESRQLGSKPIETLNRVSRYYLENKYGPAETRNMLDAFMLQCNPGVSLAAWANTLDRVVKNAKKYRLIRIDGIPVTDKELETIETVKGKQARRLAFTLLCTAKYWDLAFESNNHWVNTTDRDIFSMANVKTSIKRQSLMFSALKEQGLIRFSKVVDDLNVQVQFIQPGKTEIYVRDMRNLGYQYLKYYGEPYFECSNCGLTVKIQEPNRGRKQKYCPSCAVEMHTKQKVDSVMRRRSGLAS